MPDDKEIFMPLGDGIIIIYSAGRHTIVQVRVTDNMAIPSTYEERCRLIDAKTDDDIASIKKVFLRLKLNNEISMPNLFQGSFTLCGNPTSATE